MRVIAYNRKINAPIRFLYYLEVFDLFVITVFGFLIPLGASSFLPVRIPTWHILIWLVVLAMGLTLIKIGRAPGFVQHWLSQLTQPRSFHPGKRRVDHFLICQELYRGTVSEDPEHPFTAGELHEIHENVRCARQTRRETSIMARDQIFTG